MARVTHTPRTITQAQPTLQPAANSLDLAWTAADTVNKERVAHTGKEVILARNSGASARTVTVDGVVLLGRTGSITAYSIDAGETVVVGPLPTDGWRQTSGLDAGYLTFEASNAEVLFSVLKLQ